MTHATQLALTATLLFSTASGAFGGELEKTTYNCPQKNLIEVDGAIHINKDLSWSEVTVPDAFMIDPATIGQKDLSQIDAFVKTFAFSKKYPITGFNRYDETRAGISYKTNLGEIYQLKMFHRSNRLHGCVPASSINIRINGLPGALSYVKAQNNPSRCMWNLSVFGVHDAVTYDFYMPAQCEKAIDKPAVLKMVALFQALIPDSAYQKP